MTRFVNYLKDTLAELKHISWPTQTQATVYTALVVGVSILVAIMIALLDAGFSRGLDWFIG